jgi:hypothetical protein
MGVALSKGHKFSTNFNRPRRGFANREGFELGHRFHSYRKQGAKPSKPSSVR